MYFNCSNQCYMNTNPNENRTPVDRILLEQFLRKGYRCEEINEDDATVFIFTHEKKNVDAIARAVNETYKEILKAS